MCWYSSSSELNGIMSVAGKFNSSVLRVLYQSYVDLTFIFVYNWFDMAATCFNVLLNGPI